MESEQYDDAQQGSCEDCLVRFLDVQGLRRFYVREGRRAYLHICTWQRAKIIGLYQGPGPTSVTNQPVLQQISHNVAFYRGRTNATERMQHVGISRGMLREAQGAERNKALFITYRYT